MINIINYALSLISRFNLENQTTTIKTAEGNGTTLTIIFDDRRDLGFGYHKIFGYLSDWYEDFTDYLDMSNTLHEIVRDAMYASCFEEDDIILLDKFKEFEECVGFFDADKCENAVELVRLSKLNEFEEECRDFLIEQAELAEAQKDLEERSRYW